jgi:hypothetical protein
MTNGAAMTNAETVALSLGECGLRSRLSRFARGRDDEMKRTAGMTGKSVRPGRWEGACGRDDASNVGMMQAMRASAARFRVPSSRAQRSAFAVRCRHGIAGGHVIARSRISAAPHHAVAR